VIGGLVGAAAGRGTAALLNRVRLESEGLYPVLTIAVVIFIYSVTQLLGGSGFIAVYIAGIALGNENFIHKKSLVLFHDGIASLMQIAMFLVLGLLVYPSRLFPVASAGLNVSFFLIFIARPLAVFLSLCRSRIPFRELCMIAFVGLRGSVPIILSTYLLIAQIPRADDIFHLVFFIVLTSVLLQGTPIPWLARALHVQAPAKPKFRFPIEYTSTGQMKSELVELEVPRGSRASGKTLVNLKLPKEALLVLIQRKGSVIVPKGSTKLEDEDTMLVLADAPALEQMRQLLAAI
jgi:cell volume regulation protein A